MQSLFSTEWFAEPWRKIDFFLFRNDLRTWKPRYEPFSFSISLLFALCISLHFISIHLPVRLLFSIHFTHLTPDNVTSFCLMSIYCIDCHCSLKRWINFRKRTECVSSFCKWFCLSFTLHFTRVSRLKQSQLWPWSIQFPFQWFEANAVTLLPHSSTTR